MKTYYALALAIIMLSSMALAVDLDSIGVANVDPGETLVAKPSDFTGIAVTMNEFTSDNFNITKKSFKKGTKLVKSVGFNNEDGVVEIVLHQDYALSEPNNTNLTIEELSVKAKKKITMENGTVVNKNDVGVYNGNKDIKVGYSVIPVPLRGNPQYQNGVMVEFMPFTSNATGTISYATASIAVGEVYIEGRVYADDKVYININGDVGDVQRKTLAKHEDADLRFINVTTSGLVSNNSLLLDVGEDMFVYEVVDEKLVASSLKWSEEDYGWIGKIRTSRSYVVSDIALEVGAADKAATTGTAAGTAATLPAKK